MTEFAVRPAEEVRDITALLPVLRSAIQNPLNGQTIEEDVQAVVESVRGSAAGVNNRNYLIAETPAGTALGVMGLQAPPDPGMTEFSVTSNPAEVINAYVDGQQRGAGVGKALLSGIEKLALARGHDELIVNSGPRYRLTGWPFWTRMYGEPVAMAKDYYGTGYDAAVWRTLLSIEKN